MYAIEKFNRYMCPPLFCRTVDIMSSKSSDQPPKVSRVVASQLVCNMMDAVQQLHKLKMSSEFVSSYISIFIIEIL